MCVCVYIRAIIATVPVALRSYVDIMVIHKMGSGVQIVKWLLCGFHMHSRLISFMSRWHL